MSVDFPASSSAPTAAHTASPGKPVDLQTLQEAFAAALRNYGADSGGTSTDTMLEVLRPAANSDNAAGDDRNQQRREQQQSDRNDFTDIDRKLLDKSEVRNNEMNSDYRNRVDRHEGLRNDYQERIERNDPQQPAVQTESSNLMPATPTLDVARPNEPLPHRSQPLPQNNVPGTIGTNSPSLAANVSGNAAAAGQVNVLMPGGNLPVSMPNPAAPQTVSPQMFTLFTPSGRFGQHGKANKKENEEDETEESVEGTETTKHQPFAVFEAIQAEAIRQVKQNVSRQPKESSAPSESRQITEKPREKPKEAEPDQARNVKTLDEFLNTSAQSISVPKKGEPNQPNQTQQYLNRIAAAAEAAAHYAPIRIKINLDHWGTLTLRFFYKADKLTLRFETPSKESAQFLHENLDGLRTLLSKRNVKIASAEILLDA